MMKLSGAPALVSVLACVPGLAACLDADLASPAGTARQTRAVSTQTEPDAEYAVILIDRTGSMRNVRSTGNTRCFDAVEQARTNATAHFLVDEDDENEGVAIWLFSSALGVQQVGSGYYTNIAEVELVLDAIDHENCPATGMTTLADAMCRITVGDADNAAPLSPKPGTLYVETDGNENYSVGPCSGPRGSHRTPGTWQNKVFEELFYGGISLKTKYWLNEELLLYSGNSIDAETGKPVSGVMPNATCANAFACESELFEDLAFWTDGSYGLVLDSDIAYTCSYGDCPAPRLP